MGTNPFDYGSSILKGYLARQELDQRAQQLAQTHQEAQDLLKYHYKALDESAKQHKETMDLARLKAREEMQQNYGLIMGRPDEPQMPDWARESVSPTTQIGQAQQTPDVSPSGDMNVALTPGIQHGLDVQQAQPWQYQTDEMRQAGVAPLTIDPYYQQKFLNLAQAQGEIKARNEGLAAQLQAEGKLPSTLTQKNYESKLREGEEAVKAGYRSDLQVQKDKEAMARVLQGNAGKMDVARFTRGSAEKIAEMQDATRRYIADKKDTGLTEQNVMGAVMAGVSGQRKLGSNKYDQAASNIMQQMGWRQLDPNEAKAMGHGDLVLDALNTAQKYADTLSDQPGFGPDTVGSNIPGVPGHEEQNRLYSTLQSQLLGLTTNLSGYKNRLNLPELKWQSKGIPSSSDGRQYATEKVNETRGRWWDAQWNGSMAGAPTDQKLFMLEQMNGGAQGLVEKFSDQTVTNPWYKKGGTMAKEQEKYIPLVREAADGGHLIWNPQGKKYIPLKTVRLPQPAGVPDVQPEEDEEE